MKAPSALILPNTVVIFLLAVIIATVVKLLMGKKCDRYVLNQGMLSRANSISVNYTSPMVHIVTSVSENFCL